MIIKTITTLKGEAMLDFRMETFLKVCEYMNFTHAAHDLNLTQPAVSQHIKYLEKEYDAPLFARDKKKLTLTPAGEILRSALETMRNDENTMKIRMKESLCEKKILTFGVTMTIGEYAIVPSLSAFIKKHPDTDIRRRCSLFYTREALISPLWKGILNPIITRPVFLRQKNILLWLPKTMCFKNLFTV